MKKEQAIAETKEREGQPLTPVTLRVEKGLVERFCRVVGDNNPRWHKLAPPSLMLTIGFNEMVEDLAYGDILTVLHGSTELEPHLDVAIGDSITANSRIAKIRERQGQMGATLFITVESDCINQNNEKVALCRQVAIVY